MKTISLLLCLSLVSCKRLPDFILSEETPELSQSRKAVLLSAFFGLDNAMPDRSIAIWNEAPGKDGMPLVFSHEIDPASMNANVFRITTKKGDKLNVGFATFKPAIEEFELRTILLIGEFGDSPSNEPIEVAIVGDLKTRDGQNLKGQTIGVTPLAEGPFFSYAEYFSFTKGYPYIEKGRGCDCPDAGTETVVRTVWAGGVRAIDGNELGGNELEDFTVSLLLGSDTLKVHPYQIADLDDNDNNIDLCIKEKGTPILVEAEKGIAIDPRGDQNPYTKIVVEGRWK